MKTPTWPGLPKVRDTAIFRGVGVWAASVATRVHVIRMDRMSRKRLRQTKRIVRKGTPRGPSVFSRSDPLESSGKLGELRLHVRSLEIGRASCRERVYGKV